MTAGAPGVPKFGYPRKYLTFKLPFSLYRLQTILLRAVWSPKSVSSRILERGSGTEDLVHSQSRLSRDHIVRETPFHRKAIAMTVTPSQANPPLAHHSQYVGYFRVGQKTVRGREKVFLATNWITQLIYCTTIMRIKAQRSHGIKQRRRRSKFHRKKNFSGQSVIAYNRQ